MRHFSAHCEKVVQKNPSFKFLPLKESLKKGRKKGERREVINERDFGNKCGKVG